MSKECCVCKRRTIFFVWSSTRYFPRLALLEKIGKKLSKSKKENILIGREALPVCYKCARELGYGI